MWKNNCNFVFTHHTQGCLLANFFVAVNAAVHIKRNVAENERERKRLRVVLLRYSRWKSWFKSRFAVRAQPPRPRDCWAANLTISGETFTRLGGSGGRLSVGSCSLQREFSWICWEIPLAPHPRHTLIACSSSQFVGVLLVAGKNLLFLLFFLFIPI